ncbi:MAG TPA: helix-turn-helix domain-containing protein [Gemmatimonadaceae bacterium]|jgi:HTH-type transcriptional regulator/antitoxin HigA|nr:helix-turn-helix domain-containing protein [Gemmatimonadaceae bacterium]
MSASAVVSRPIAPIEHPIRSEREYNAIVREMDALLDADPRKGTAEYDRLELLSVLVEAWEDENEPEPDLPSPQEVVKFMAEQKGVSAGKLADLLGGRSRLSDFMNGKRELSREQVKKLRTFLGVPADLLIPA